MSTAMTLRMDHGTTPGAAPGFNAGTTTPERLELLALLDATLQLLVPGTHSTLRDNPELALPPQLSLELRFQNETILVTQDNAALDPAWFVLAFRLGTVPPERQEEVYATLLQQGLSTEHMRNTLFSLDLSGVIHFLQTFSTQDASPHWLMQCISSIAELTQK